jgi:transcriptional regulator with XRE-family HTH domain
MAKRTSKAVEDYIPPPTMSDVFRERLRIERGYARLSQQDLATRLTEAGYKTENTAVTRWESGERRLMLEDVLNIAKVLGLSPAWMLHFPEADIPPDAGPDSQARRVRIGTDVVASDVAREWLTGQRQFLDRDAGVLSERGIDLTASQPVTMADRLAAIEARLDTIEGRSA